MMYIDLAELGALFDGRALWSVERWNVASFRRADYLGRTGDLDGAVRDLVQARLGFRPGGAIRVLTNIRTLGLVFNPVTFYYCFDPAGALCAVIAEITNTPWGERHRYCLRASADGTARAEFDKRFHVSPFQPMEQDYAWALSVPGERLGVHMQNRRGDDKVFDATLAVQRRPWTTKNLTAAFLRHPCMALQVVLAIYWHAFRLWWKRAPFYTHPKKRVAA